MKTIMKIKKEEGVAILTALIFFVVVFTYMKFATTPHSIQQEMDGEYTIKIYDKIYHDCVRVQTVAYECPNGIRVIN